MHNKLNGVFIPVVTPFINQEIAFDKLSYNISKWNNSNVRGYMVLGTNGEFRSLSDNEAVNIIHQVNLAKTKEKVLIAGVGRESLYLVQKFIERISGFDIDYISILPPHYFKKSMTDSVLVDFYTKIAEFSPFPVTLYCAPSYSNGVNISEKVVSEVSAHPNIHGIKDTSSDMMMKYCSVATNRTDFTILSGTLGNFIEGIKNGAKGGVLSAANYMPDQCCKLYEMLIGEKYKEAEKYAEKLFELYNSTSKDYGVAGVKACMDINGYYGGGLRLPLSELNEKLKAELEVIFKNYIEEL